MAATSLIRCHLYHFLQATFTRDIITPVVFCVKSTFISIHIYINIAIKSTETIRCVNQVQTTLATRIINNRVVRLDFCCRQYRMPLVITQIWETRCQKNFRSLRLCDHLVITSSPKESKAKLIEFKLFRVNLTIFPILGSFPSTIKLHADSSLQQIWLPSKLKSKAAYCSMKGVVCSGIYF